MLFTRKRYLLLAILFKINLLFAQDLTGTWEGILGNTEFLQVNIIQVDNVLCGYSWDYIYADRSSYCKAYFSGHYDDTYNKWVLTGTSFMVNSGDHVLMRMVLSYKENGDDLVLSGKEMDPSFPVTPLSMRMGQVVYLRKVSDRPRGMTSNMRECINASKKNETRNDDEFSSTENVPPPMRPRPPVVKKGSDSKPKPPTVVKRNPTVKKNSPPATVKTAPVKVNPTVKSSPPVVANKPAGKPKPAVVVPKKVTAVKPVQPKVNDSVVKTRAPVIPAIRDADGSRVTKLMGERKNKEMKRLMVSEKFITLNVYDNGIIDSDTVSIFYNGKLILSHKRLSEKPIIIPITLDEKISTHEITLFAENLGSIPPNTALVVVHAGEKRYELFASASLTENAVIAFEYKGE